MMVPQMSLKDLFFVLLFFLIFFNDIVTDVDSKINLLADDCALYLEMTSAEDSIGLQKDLDRLVFLFHNSSGIILDEQRACTGAKRQSMEWEGSLYVWCVRLRD